MAAASGSRAVKVAPLPRPSLAAVTSPPWARMMPLEMVSPIPVPESLAVFGPCAHAIEAFEHLLQIRGREANTGVGNRDVHPRTGLDTGHGHRAARRCGPDRVADQVGDDLADPISVGIDHERTGTGSPLAA